MITYTYPFNALLDLQKAFDSAFDSPFFGNTLSARGAYPTVNIFEDDKGEKIYLVAELPGMKKEQININFQKDTLTLSGEIVNKEKKGAHRLERKYGKFSRSVTIPHAVDPAKIAANYENGILTVTMIKAEEDKPKKITIS